MKHCKIMNKDIDYGSLYGVKPGENDFSGAIKRALNENIKIKHLDNNFINVFNAYKCLRHHTVLN